MTKYLHSERFFSPANSDAYRDGWERAFGEKAKPLVVPSKCEACGLDIDDSNINWCSISTPLCVVCASVHEPVCEIFDGTVCNCTPP